MNDETHSNIKKCSVEVKSASLGVIVSVLFYGKARMLGQRNMISPGWSRHVNFLITGEKCRQECSANTEWAGTRNALNSSILQRLTIKQLSIIKLSTANKDVLTKPFWTHSLPSPRARLIDALQNSGGPDMGAYSLSMFLSTILVSA